MNTQNTPNKTLIRLIQRQFDHF